jgi:hypothetical protein
MTFPRELFVDWEERDIGKVFLGDNFNDIVVGIDQ